MYWNCSTFLMMVLCSKMHYLCVLACFTHHLFRNYMGLITRPDNPTCANVVQFPALFSLGVKLNSTL